MAKIRLRTKLDDTNEIPGPHYINNVPAEAARPENDSWMSPDIMSIDPILAEEYRKRVSVLNECAVLAENPADIHDERQRMKVFAKLSFGLRKAGEALAWVSYHQKIAYATRKETEGVAALDDYQTYVAQAKAEGKIDKPTEKMREYYVQTHAGVLAAHRKEALVNSMVESISTLRLQFIQSISTLRALAYGVRDSSFISSASVTE